MTHARVAMFRASGQGRSTIWCLGLALAAIGCSPSIIEPAFSEAPTGADGSMTVTDASPAQDKPPLPDRGSQIQDARPGQSDGRALDGPLPFDGAPGHDRSDGGRPDASAGGAIDAATEDGAADATPTQACGVSAQLCCAGGGCLTGLACSGGRCVHNALESVGPVVGAIRYDTWRWDTTADPPPREGIYAPNHAQNLFPNRWCPSEPEQWYYRAPFFGSISSDGSVKIREDSQEVIDQEIGYASAAGLKFFNFAFCVRPDGNPNPNGYGLDLYLRSTHINEINYALRLGVGGCLDTADNWESRTIPALVGHFQRPTYQKVLSDRPLLFIWAAPQYGDWVEFFGGGAPDAGAQHYSAGKQALDQLRQATRAQGLGDPYVVALVFQPERYRHLISDVGYDAMGSYSSGVLAEPPSGTSSPMPYCELAQGNVEFARGTSDYLKIHWVPNINSGADSRPISYPRTCNDGLSPPLAWYEQATPSQVAMNLRKMLAWMTADQADAPAQAALIYAWNEFTEGGWICPMLDEGPARLDAIQQLLLPNKLYNPSMESVSLGQPEGGWGANGAPAVPQFLAMGPSASDAHKGQWYARALVDQPPTAGSLWISSPLTPVPAGATVHVNSWVRGNASRFGLEIVEYDADLAQVHVTDGPRFSPDAWAWYDFAPTVGSFSTTLRDDTAFVILMIRGDYPATPGRTVWLDVDDASVATRSSAFSDPCPAGMCGCSGF
jgi:hypothetical protein